MDTKKQEQKTPKKAPEKRVEQDQYTKLLDRVIGQLAEDEQSLAEQIELIENAQSYKREVQGRVRDLRRDLATFVKYSSPEQLEKIKAMGLDTEDLGQTLNKVSEIAFEIMQNAENGEMTNGKLYDAYVSKFNHPEDALDYTHFNIKCRSLFNSQRLLRIEVEGKKSRDFIIRINGFKPKTE